MAETITALTLLSRRINEKQQSLGLFDMGIIDSAIEEINRLRRRESMLEAELEKKIMVIAAQRTKGSGDI